jgi:hypothetical protein
MVEAAGSIVYTRKVVLCSDGLTMYTTRMSGYAKQQAKNKIIWLAGQSLDLVTFWCEANEALAPAVPHYMGCCWYTLDPVSLLVTSHFNTEMPDLPPEWLVHEYSEDDFHKIADIAQSEQGISTIHEATGGDPSLSPGWNLYVRPYGGDQELLVALRTSAGEAWGMLGLYRAPGQPLFDSDERCLLREVAPYLAEAARRGLLIGEKTGASSRSHPALHAGSTSCPTAIGRRVTSYPHQCWQWPGAPCALPSTRMRPVRSRSHGCWPELDAGWCSTAPRLSPMARGALR